MALPAPIPLEEAQARLLALVSRLDVEEVPVADAQGRYLAAPLQARRTQPAADLSAMDGYAVTIDDIAGPWEIVGESAAGHPYHGTLARGQAVRISTGALMPADAGAVILQEDVSRRDATITLTGDGPNPADRHIRRRAMDFAAGDTILSQGTRLGPSQLGLALAAGHDTLSVCRRPRLAVIDSGDELAGNLQDCADHLIPASNGAMLLAAACVLPIEGRRIGPIPDRIDALIAAFESAGDADVIVTSGGASVGDHDLVRPALESWGAQIDFWRIAIKPGKPLLVATRKAGDRKQIVIGLPGNPVSSLVTAYHFLMPLLRALLGAAQSVATPVQTTLAEPLAANGPRREFLRGTWDGQSVHPRPLQDSGALASLAASNVLIDRPIGAPAASAGEKVNIYLLQYGGIA